METLSTLYMGVDVGSTHLVISDGVAESSQKLLKLATQEIKNDSHSINSWIATLASNAHIIFEATGTYSLPLAYCLSIAEINFSIITPSQSKGLAETLKVTTRNDAIDAVILAIYGANYQPQITLLESEQIHQLKQKRKHLSALIKQKQMLSNQLHAISFDAKADKDVVESLTFLQETLQLQIQKFTDDIYTLNQDEYNHIYELMTSVVGIGPASANAIIIATNGLQDFDSPKAVVKFLGLAPKEKESGKSVYKKYGISKTGVGFVRSTLYNAAKSAKKFNIACKNLYNRLRANGKCHKVAMIAVINKLVRQVFAVVKSNTKFDNFFAQPNKISPFS